MSWNYFDYHSEQKCYSCGLGCNLVKRQERILKDDTSFVYNFITNKLNKEDQNKKLIEFFDFSYHVDESGNKLTNTTCGKCQKPRLFLQNNPCSLIKRYYFCEMCHSIVQDRIMIEDVLPILEEAKQQIREEFKKTFILFCVKSKIHMDICKEIKKIIPVYEYIQVETLAVYFNKEELLKSKLYFDYKKNKKNEIIN